MIRISYTGVNCDDAGMPAAARPAPAYPALPATPPLRVGGFSASGQCLMCLLQAGPNP
ncbi:hypothetical protein SAMN02745193_00400 [Erythrobacter sanguineus]|jgi:hypothetical protein|uniref:Uncharacterized protein n=1 Tax=Erythrobacter sanguineus TaxID=198312 RepID=A0A1M7RUC0_9SPHN|nr:hypothetical protein SAMN02745193_00400 [Erythrobacter sanguineus]